MAGDFDGKVVLVTGSSTGLGAAIALGAAKRGAKAVIVNYASSKKEADETADLCRKAGAEVAVVQGDVGEDADCRKIAEAAAKFGKIDALANNAGITKIAPNHGDLNALSKDDFLRVYAVNTVGPFQMIRAARSLLEASGKASVVMTSSIAAVTGVGSSVAYAASKGALNTMTISLARGWRRKSASTRSAPASSIRRGSPRASARRRRRRCARTSRSRRRSRPLRPPRTSPIPRCFCCRIIRGTSPARR